MFKKRRLPSQINMSEAYLATIVRLLVIVVIGTLVGVGSWYVHFSGGLREALSRFTEDGYTPLKEAYTLKEVNESLPPLDQNHEDKLVTLDEKQSDLVEIFKAQMVPK